MAVERRSLIQILGAGLTATQLDAQHSHSASAKATVPYAPRALSPAEYRVVDRLAEMILPADESSPGAHDAAVARYIDIVLLYGRKETLASWKSGVESVETIAREKHGRAFGDLATDEQMSLVRAIAVNEMNPTTSLERFFVTVKELAIEAFYLSAAGKKSLGYKGDTAVSEFPGCTHPEHKG